MPRSQGVNLGVFSTSSTIYCAFTPEMKRAAGIEDTLVRFSAGLEDMRDLMADIDGALDAL